MSSRRSLGQLAGHWEIVVGAVCLGAVLASRRTNAAGAADSVRPLLPVIAFLISVLVVAEVCAVDGLFDALGARIAVAGTGSASRLLGLGFVTAAVVTSTLNLDATVVLLTPVLLAGAVHSGHSARPAAWTSIRLANSASTLFPVSNLTNLLAYSATGLTFVRFTWLMSPVWLTALLLEWGVVRMAFRSDLRTPRGPAEPADRRSAELPRFDIAVIGLMLVAFVLGSPLDLDPALPAAAAAVVLVAVATVRRRTGLREVVRSAGLPLAFLVLSWAVVIELLGKTAVGDALAALLPDLHGGGSLSLTATVGVAVVSMLLANLVNNLPATLLLVPLVAPLGPVGLLAMLIGVNVGANLTYLGSLANLLWLRVVGTDAPSARRFHLIALASTPATVVMCAVVLWAWARVTS